MNKSIWLKTGDVVGSFLSGEAVGNQTGLKSCSINLSLRIDESSTVNTTYVGYAEIGSSELSASWRIKRITELNGILVLLYADGNDNFDNVWDNRTSLSYS